MKPGEPRAEHERTRECAAEHGHGDGAGFAARVGDVQDRLRQPVQPVLQQPFPGVEAQEVVVPGAGEELPRPGKRHGNAARAGEPKEVLEIPDQLPVPDEAAQALAEERAAPRGAAALGTVPREDALAIGQRGGVQPELDGEVSPHGPGAEHAARGRPES